MIAAISSADSSFEETQNTLKYANRAKNIKTNAQRNVLNVNYHISEYVQLITNLRSEIKMLKDQLVHNDSEDALQSHDANRYDSYCLIMCLFGHEPSSHTSPQS